MAKATTTRRASSSARTPRSSSPAKRRPSTRETRTITGLENELAVTRSELHLVDTRNARLRRHEHDTNRLLCLALVTLVLLSISFATHISARPTR